jgi:hypothetical protein
MLEYYIKKSVLNEITPSVEKQNSEAGRELTGKKEFMTVGVLCKN